MTLLVLALILVPFAVGVGLRWVRSDAIRKILVAGALLAVCCLSVALAMAPDSTGLKDLPVRAHAINLGMLLVEIAMSLFIIYIGVRAKNVPIVLLTLAQAGLKNTGMEAIAGDLTYLLVFSIVALAAATALFKRTL